MHLNYWFASLAVYSVAAAEGRTFVLTREEAPVTTSPRAPASHLARTLSAYGRQVPRHVQAAASKAATSVAGQPVALDSHYTVKVTVGNSTLNLDLKTSSGDL